MVLRTVNLDALEDVYELERDFFHRHYPALSRRMVRGEGNSPVAMVVGEAPGAQEDQSERPFVGAAGKVLRQLMESVGLTTGISLKSFDSESEGNCWLTNVVKFRPPGNRVPTDAERDTARGFLLMEWSAIDRPRLIIPVGGTALRAVLGQKRSILAFSGKVYTRRSITDGKPLYIAPMIHPSFGLRQPAVRQMIEMDWDNLDMWMGDHEHLIG